MVTLNIYNSLNKQLEPFQSISEEKGQGKKAYFYTCGPTVYDYAHIGNFRSFLNADLLRRALEFLGYEVVQVMNMTDVGHMTEDDVADGGGQDKMEAAQQRLKEAKKSGKLPTGVELNANDPFAIANFYADAFIADAKTLGLRIIDDYEKDIKWMPKPTAFIDSMIAFIQSLEEKGFAYQASDGVVYFDIQKFEKYGELSGNHLDNIQAGKGGRVNEEDQAVKKHPADFMLWKPDDKHLMRWKSPWGEGYPGWHLECSVMANDLLGKFYEGVIDLHSGGEDNIFPHHECEIAQSCAANGQSHFARYWFHTRFLRVEGEKMSKSLGNFFTLKDLMDKGTSPAAIRLELTRMHYRQQANFTFQGIKDCQRMIDRWLNWQEALEKGKGLHSNFQSIYSGFEKALSEDLNISGALGALNQGFKETDLEKDNPNAAEHLNTLKNLLNCLGVLKINCKGEQKIDAEFSDKVDALINAREIARQSKDWTEADRIRDVLSEMGVVINDVNDSQKWSLKN